MQLFYYAFKWNDSPAYRRQFIRFVSGSSSFLTLAFMNFLVLYPF